MKIAAKLERLLIVLITCGLLGQATTLWGESSADQLNRGGRKPRDARPLPQKSQVVAGDILVKYRMPPLTRPLTEKMLSARSQELKDKGVHLAQKYGARPAATYPALGIQLLKVPPALVSQTIAKLRQNDFVARASLNYKIYPLYTQPPNDELWANGTLWGIEKIGMKKIWDTGFIPGDVIIAVLDTGIDYSHPDLVDHMWINPNLGITDHIHGARYCDGVEGGNPKDNDGHGTWVAGIIGAQGDNWTTGETGKSVVGIAWKSKTQVMALNVLCNTGAPSGTVADAIGGMDYALRKNAVVLNNSWAIVGDDVLLEDIEVLEAAVGELNAHNILFVASAGNTSRDNDGYAHYPSNLTLENVIAVAASTENDELWIGSNWGRFTVHLAAPGHLITSTYPGGNTDLANGTSASAPHVAGCAGLLQAKRVAAGLPLLRPIELKNVLMNSGDALNPLAGSVDLSARSDGLRRLNCFKAMEGPPAAPTNLRVQ